MAPSQQDPIGFGGQYGYYTDVETGLVLLTHRYYDPQNGRFLTRDPVGYAGGLNLYSLGLYNPVNNQDPNGFSPVGDAAGVVGLVPGPVGEAANLVSGLDSLAEGDYLGAALSLGGEVPGLGEFATGAKIIRAANRLRKAERVEKITIGALRNAGRKDAHHIIQDAAVRDLHGYRTNSAPGIQLRGPANDLASPHGLTRPIQQQAGGGTYAAERRIGYKTLRRAGVSRAEARSHIRNADEYRSYAVGSSCIVGCLRYWRIASRTTSALAA